MQRPAWHSLPCASASSGDDDAAAAAAAGGGAAPPHSSSSSSFQRPPLSPRARATAAAASASAYAAACLPRDVLWLQACFLMAAAADALLIGRPLDPAGFSCEAQQRQGLTLPSFPCSSAVPLQVQPEQTGWRDWALQRRGGAGGGGEG